MKSTRKTILFVEDNPLVLGVYRDWLQWDGFRVESAHDGLAALEQLLHWKPDVVILDLMLLQLNGLEVLKFIREHPDFKGIPVMILSNPYLEEPASKIMSAGANKRILKTQCTPKELIEAVRELLKITPGSHGRSQNASTLAEANAALLEETRKQMLEDAPADIACIREHCQAFVKTAGSPEGTEPLNALYQQVRFLCTRASLSDCPKIAHLLSALEAMLFEIISEKSLPSKTLLQTIVQALDCLGRLFQNGDIRSAEGIHKAKVLVVDDDPICNFANAATMKRAKIEVTSMQMPLAALERAQTELFNIVLLDIEMPGLNGFELCEKIRLLPQYQKTPIIFVTSHGEFQNRAQAVLSGGNDVIAKPIFPMELVLKTILHLIESAPGRPIKLPAAAGTPSAAASAVAIPSDPQELPEGQMPAAAGNDAIEAPVVASTDDPPAAVPQNGHWVEMAVETVAPAGETDVNQAAGHHLPPEVEIPAPVVIPLETLPVNRISQSKSVPNAEMPMKSQNIKQPFEVIAQEVTRIIFGDENLSEMHLRLTRIALERYGVHEIISHSSGLGARSNGSMTNGDKGDPFQQVVHGVAHIMFGEENLSEMHLRLTGIALERYRVRDLFHRPGETNGHNGSQAEHVLEMRP